MWKYVTRVAAALVTFTIGTSIVMLWPAPRREVAADVQPPAPQVVSEEVSPLPDGGWRKVTVEGRFSFYVPRYLKDGPRSVSRLGELGEFRSGDYGAGGLFHLYYHSHKEVSEYEGAPSRYKATTRSEVTISGKSATIVTEIPADEEVICIHDTPTVQVYFPDIGRGRKLYMRLASRDAVGIEAAKQIINSIEFP